MKTPESTHKPTPYAHVWTCLECSKKFRSLAAVEKAVSVGCPKCGGVDIDLVAPR